MPLRNHNTKLGVNNARKSHEGVQVIEFDKNKDIRDKFRVSYSDYKFPVEKNVPAGYYLSEIKGIEYMTNHKGRECLDVHYEFFPANGPSHFVLQRYPMGSFSLEKLHRAMGEAGLPNGAPMEDAIGILEKVRFVYDYDSGYGSIVERVPYVDPEDENDDDYDDMDYLNDED